MTIEERVQAGATFLDANVPGWWKKIDLEKLDISSPFDCIIGQLYGRCYYGLEVLGCLLGCCENKDNLGFALSVYCKDTYCILTKIWKNLIQQRQNAQSVEHQSIQNEQKSLQLV